MSQLWYINKVKSSEQTAFSAKVRTISALLKINPNWLMYIINRESAGSFSPSIVNEIGATGLIQFLKSTAEWLGTSTYLLARMTATQQLDYVYKFYKPFAGKFRNIEDMYLYTFYMYAIGKQANYILGSEVSPKRVRYIRDKNSSIDLNHDYKITLGEWRTSMQNRIAKSGLTQAQINELYTNPYTTQTTTKSTSYAVPIIIGIGIGIAYLSTKKQTKNYGTIR